MNTAQTAQLNVRMDRSLKEAGDAALASAGFNPSEAVRALWAKAARRGEDLERLVAVLRDVPVQEEDAADGEPAHPFEEGRRQILESLKRMGITDFTTPVSLSDEELYEMALVERMEERGLV